MKREPRGLYTYRELERERRIREVIESAAIWAVVWFLGWGLAANLFVVLVLVFGWRP